MKYVVMECRLSYAVVLDEEGRFLKVANRHYEVGQTVTEVIEMQISEAAPQKKKTKRWIYSFAAMAACLALVVTSVLQMQQVTYGSVYMTINPEVRIDVNKNDVVVGLAGVNPDGEDLIEGYRFKKKDLDLVMDELVDKAIDMGYLHAGGQISLTLDADSDEWVITHGEALTSHLNAHLKEKLPVTIEVTKEGSVSIPIEPNEDDYGESDYGEKEAPVTAPVTIPKPVPAVPREPDDSESNYGDGQTDYGSQETIDDIVEDDTDSEDNNADDDDGDEDDDDDDDSF